MAGGGAITNGYEDGSNEYFTTGRGGGGEMIAANKSIMSTPNLPALMDGAEGIMQYVSYLIQ